jgi:hypothetical protein
LKAGGTSSNQVVLVGVLPWTKWREDAKAKAELESRMIALQEAKAMKELLAEEREIMMMRTDDMDEDQLA